MFGQWATGWIVAWWGAVFIAAWGASAFAIVCLFIGANRKPMPRPRDVNLLEVTRRADAARKAEQQRRHNAPIIPTDEWGL